MIFRRLFYLLLFSPIAGFAQQKPSFNISETNVNRGRYDSLLNAYKAGRKDYGIMPYLAKTAKALRQNEMANKIARDFFDNYLANLKGKALYNSQNMEFIRTFNQSSPEVASQIALDIIDNYLLNLKDEPLFTKENMDFIRRFNQTSADRAFKLFYDNGPKIDRIAGRSGYVREHIDYIIAKEEIDPNLWRDKIAVTEYPDWVVIEKGIAHKYNKVYAERTVLNAKIRWFTFKKDSLSLLKYDVEKIDKYGLDTLGAGKVLLNNMVYYLIFRHSNDKATLNKAAGWMEVILNAEPNNASFVDTYANLLYKAGKTTEALSFEEKATKLAPNNKEILNCYSRMQQGEPTWK